MRPPKAEKQWKSRTIQISAVDTAQHEQRMHEEIARRAFVIFESRGSSPADALGDWRRAEFEVVRPLQCGFMVGDEEVSVETDASTFEEGPIEICVEPRRLTICGKCSAHAISSPEPVFYVLDLPVAVDPSGVTTRFNGCVLMIELPRREQILVPGPRDVDLRGPIFESATSGRRNAPANLLPPDASYWLGG